MEEHPMFLRHEDGTVERLDAEGIRLAERNRILGVVNGLKVLRVPNDATPDKPLSNDNYTEYVRLQTLKEEIVGVEHKYDPLNPSRSERDLIRGET